MSDSLFFECIFSGFARLFGEVRMEKDDINIPLMKMRLFKNNLKNNLRN